jgi:Rrf2 family nitric oxide-sensitive transcriptional repressor
MHLTMYTDYALRTLIYLATHPEGSTVAEIARAYGVSRNHLVKVVHNLGRVGYIHTTKGRSGGICLAKPAASIRLNDVVLDMEPHMEIVECFGEHPTCPITPVCRLRKVLREAGDAFMEVLADYTLADVAANARQLNTLLGTRVVAKART